MYLLFFRKMANTLSREIPLKFTKNGLREIDTPNLLIKVWTYNYYKPRCQNCNACKIYTEWNVEILAERWKEEWGNMNNAIERLKKKKTIKILLILIIIVAIQDGG